MMVVCEKKPIHKGNKPKLTTHWARINATTLFCLFVFGIKAMSNKTPEKLSQKPAVNIEKGSHNNIIKSDKATA